ncbi:hypothetical protein FBU30_000702, partial [Linnemannia zychae]
MKNIKISDARTSFSYPCKELETRLTGDMYKEIETGCRCLMGSFKEIDSSKTYRVTIALSTHILNNEGIAQVYHDLVDAKRKQKLMDVTLILSGMRLTAAPAKNNRIGLYFRLDASDIKV